MIYASHFYQSCCIIEWSKVHCMKEIMLRYIGYNLWANTQLMSVIQTLSDEETQQPLGGSFTSIQQTIEHLWLAESVWLQRLRMNEHVRIPTEHFNGNCVQAAEQWLACSAELLEFTNQIHDDRGLEHQFHYTNIKGEFQKSKVWECLQHVCNHSTFHRGQLITYLRQIGKEHLPSTDFIQYCRKIK